MKKNKGFVLQKLLLASLVATCAGSIIISPKQIEGLPAPEQPKQELSHAQEVWIHALEWCESRGDTKAINPNDADNTPSYYSWQWKPTTFKYFAEMYGVIEKGLPIETIKEMMKSYELQNKVITEMVLNRKSINWSQQFPVCIHNLGTPPA